MKKNKINNKPGSHGVNESDWDLLLRNEHFDTETGFPYYYLYKLLISKIDC